MIDVRRVLFNILWELFDERHHARPKFLSYTASEQIWQSINVVRLLMMRDNVRNALILMTVLIVYSESSSLRHSEKKEDFKFKLGEHGGRKQGWC